ncbi:pilus assembly protein [Uliginosibacterium sp. H1]|uniref:pilus assembly protein n=1 Tax=Uliginosibacterium sp. H1 TaxID=3114757 RepID=UPI002E18CFD9|nr:PilC/PilY family type IV pilus protein [Uliginosibacterium sp. H1]
MNKFSPRRALLPVSIAALLGGTALHAADIPISTVPLDVALNQANSVMVIDDSGSMDFEMILSANSDGVLYWNNGSYNGTGSGSKSPFLFPLGWDGNGSGFFVGDMNLADHYAVPYLAEYAYLRSADYNPIYYNPRITYTPWPSAVVDGNMVTFADAPPAAARSHPYLTSGGTWGNTGTATVVNLTATYYGPNTTSPANCAAMATTANTDNRNWTFRVFQGMTLPRDASTCYRRWNMTSTVAWQATNTSGNSADINAAGVVQRDLEVAIPYRPATFFMRDATCTAAWPACGTGPGSTNYRLYDINAMTGSSYTLPDGTVISRTKAQELQNFANWFTYYRKRKLMMASSMGTSLSSVQKNFRQFSAAPVFMHSLPTLSNTSPTLYDFTKNDNAVNGLPLIGHLYKMRTAGGTPTVAALNRAGETYGYSGPFNNYLTSRSSTDSITDETTAQAALRCSANTAFVLTDGYATVYDGTNTIYSTAKTYYDNLRWWNPTSGNIGKTMNTYGITLGALGQAYQGDANAADPNPWPTPAGGQPTAIDDLWRATKYSKGTLLSATNPTELDTKINQIITDMFNSGTGSNISLDDPYIDSGTTALQANYNSGDWSGELRAYGVFPANGLINYSNLKWSAQGQLDSRTAASRIIATWNPTTSAGIPFTSAALTGAGRLDLFNTGAANDGADVVAWLRGDRSLESTRYRKRGHLLGAIVNSSPAYVNEAFAKYGYAGYSAFAESVRTRTDVVYVGANDGMLHAFRADTGAELWAYVPGLVHNKLNALAQPAYTNQFTVDGKLTAWDVEFTSGSGSTATTTWKTVLIGGLRGGGKGYYAIDVTSPEAASETALASKVLWEFTDADMGLSYGKPQIVKTKSYGWVALLPSGYNNTGNGHLYVVSIQTGQLVKKLTVNLTAGAYSQVGLAEVTATIDTADQAAPQRGATVKYVYGGDLNGNLWRFNLGDADSNNWSSKLLAANLNINGTAGATAITAAPAVGIISTPGPFPAYQNSADTKTSRLMVFVGNGKLLHGSDFSTDDRNNGFYAIEDADDNLVIGADGCASLGCLVQVGLGQTSASLGLNNWSSPSNASLTKWWVADQHSFNLNGVQRVKRGWYVRFSETGGERVIGKPVFINGAVTFTTTMKTDSRHTAAGTCEAAYSAMYVMGADKGGALGATSRVNMGFGIATEPVIAILPDGKFIATVGMKGVEASQLTGSGVITSGGANSAPVMGGVPIGTSGADGQSIVIAVPPPEVVSGGDLQRYGWREIYR